MLYRRGTIQGPPERYLLPNGAQPRFLDYGRYADDNGDLEASAGGLSEILGQRGQSLRIEPVAVRGHEGLA